MDKERKNTPILLDGNKCPVCREVLSPVDLEMFSRCPYCDHRFPAGSQLEDFILEPVLRRWVSHTCQQFNR